MLVAPAVRQGNRSGHQILDDTHGHAHGGDWRNDIGEGPLGDSDLRCILGVHMQVVGLEALGDKRLDIMRPGVVCLVIAFRDQAESRLGLALGLPFSFQPLCGGQKAFGRQMHQPVCGNHPFAEEIAALSGRPQAALRFPRQSIEATLAGNAQQHREKATLGQGRKLVGVATGMEGHRHLQRSLRDTRAEHRNAGGPAEVDVDARLVTLFAGGRHDGFGRCDVGTRLHAEKKREGKGQVGALHGGRRGQHVMGERACFVAVDVQRDQ